MNADYKCKTCGKLTNYDKPYGEDFPQDIECSCKELATRIFNKMPTTSVARGNTGLTYHGSPFTPHKMRRKSLTLSDRD